MALSDPLATSPALPGMDQRTLREVVVELRRLAVVALDAGHPVAAAQIAGTADRLDASLWRGLPPRPDYGEVG